VLLLLIIAQSIISGALLRCEEPLVLLALTVLPVLGRDGLADVAILQDTECLSSTRGRSENEIALPIAQAAHHSLVLRRLRLLGEPTRSADGLRELTGVALGNRVGELLGHGADLGLKGRERRRHWFTNGEMLERLIESRQGLRGHLHRQLRPGAKVEMLSTALWRRRASHEHLVNTRRRRMGEGERRSDWHSANSSGVPFTVLHAAKSLSQARLPEC
jgi:hypothetical protein